jgi:hypothetical protein
MAAIKVLTLLHIGIGDKPFVQPFFFSVHRRESAISFFYYKIENTIRLSALISFFCRNSLRLPVSVCLTSPPLIYLIFLQLFRAALASLRAMGLPVQSVLINKCKTNIDRKSGEPPTGLSDRHR